MDSAWRSVGSHSIRVIEDRVNMMRDPPLLIGFLATELEARAYLAMHRQAFRANLRLSCDEQPPA